MKATTQINKYLNFIHSESKARIESIKECPEYFHDGFDYDLIQTFEQFCKILERIKVLQLLSNNENSKKFDKQK